MRRIIAGAALLIVAAFAQAAVDGDYCMIPKLVRGEPTLVEVARIDAHFCGVAMIDNRYVRLSEVMKSVDESQACDKGFCTRTALYYTDEERKTAPYILIFQAPEKPDPA